jgi:hypothetical protein
MASLGSMLLRDHIGLHSQNLAGGEIEASSAGLCPYSCPHARRYTCRCTHAAVGGVSPPRQQTLAGGRGVRETVRRVGEAVWGFRSGADRRHGIGWPIGRGGSETADGSAWHVEGHDGGR